MCFCHDFKIGRKPHKLITLILLGFKVRTGFYGTKIRVLAEVLFFLETPGVGWGRIRFPCIFRLLEIASFLG